MIRFLIHRPKWIVVIVGFLVFWLTQTTWLTKSHLWLKADGALIDRRYLLRNEILPDPNIKLIGVGNTSFQLDTLSRRIDLLVDDQELATRAAPSPAVNKALRGYHRLYMTEVLQADGGCDFSSFVPEPVASAP